MLKIDQYELKYVCDIIPEIDDNGNIIEYYPQELYRKKENVKLHEYGKRPFCRFKIPTCWAGKEGVYCIYSDDQLVYVGECVDLSKRFNMGYGNISPVFVRNDGYEKLSAYLKRINGDSIKLTFNEIERIINRPLPQSAYRYKAWWANGGHSHSNYWLNAGWKVERVALGNYIVFSRIR